MKKNINYNIKNIGGSTFFYLFWFIVAKAGYQQQNMQSCPHYPKLFMT